MNLEKYIQKNYGNMAISQCPFTKKEIAELDKTNELMVYLPSKISMKELCELLGIKCNINFDNERLIRNVMIDEDQWFITSANRTSELLYTSAQNSKREYEDQGLQGMDFRRYLAFLVAFKDKFDNFPDQSYWTFLLSGSYDRSGVSILGFDREGILNHQAWMKDFKSKFAGSRYIVLPPRIDINPETENLSRAYRSKK